MPPSACKSPKSMTLGMSFSLMRRMFCKSLYRRTRKRIIRK